jgi:PAP2 superfamily
MLVAGLSPLFRIEDEGSGVAAASAGSTIICRISRPGGTIFTKQLELVRAYADLRLDRMAEILAQEMDILSFFAAVMPMSVPRRKATFELLTAVQSLCIGLEMQAKHYCWAPRPTELASDIQPAIPTPEHSTFPSGHATEAFAVATVLHRLASGAGSSTGLAQSAMLFRLAHRIAANRTVAGLHFPVDSAAGAMLGCAIGDAFCAMLAGEKLQSRSFVATADFDDCTLSWLRTNATASPSDQAPSAPAFARAQWLRAAGEWKTAT